MNKKIFEKLAIQLIFLINVVIRESVKSQNNCKKNQMFNSDCTWSYNKLIFNDLDLSKNVSFLINSADLDSTRCFSYCNLNTNCIYILFKSNKCYLCNQTAIFYLINSSKSDGKVYKKGVNDGKNPNYKQDLGLQNYWTFNENVNDSIGQAHLLGGLNVGFTDDRFNNSKSALKLAIGYYQVPPGVYFNSDFCVMAWVKIRSIKFFSRIIDFGSGSPSDNILITTTVGTSGKSAIHVYSTNNYIVELYSDTILPINQWIHLSFVLIKPTAYFYINGQLDKIFTQPGSGSNPQNVVRTNNFIGKSNWFGSASDEHADADYDDLKIFKRGLLEEEIRFEMNNYL